MEIPHTRGWDHTPTMEEMLAYNTQFVEKKEYEQYATDKYPAKKLAVLTCMDTRLTTLLPAALGLKNGDAKIIKNAGGIITHPYGSAMHSLLISIYELGVEEILVVGHDDCGVQNLDGAHMLEAMRSRGIDAQTIETICSTECDLRRWMSGFHDVEKSVRKTVEAIRQHPLVPAGIEVYGVVMNPQTGRIRTV